MEVPKPEQFGLTLERIHQVEDRLWRLRLVAAIAIGLAAGLLGLYLLHGFLLSKGSRDIVFDTLMVALPISIFVGAAGGMASFILLLSLPVSLGEDHARLRRYQAAVAQVRRQLRKAYHDHWAGMGEKRLRREVGELYRRLGYELLPVPKGKAESADLVLRKEGTTVLVNCRPREAPVDWQQVRAVAEARERLKVDHALVISIPGFTARAKRFAANRPLGLLSLRELVNMQLHLEDQEGAKTEALSPSEEQPPRQL
ncbi:MAG: restriction endonuclease [Sphingomonadaceae bacterium]